MMDKQPRTPPTKGPGRRFRDLAVLLPCLGILLLATPVVSIFTQSGRVFGLPLPIFYVFGIWGGLIVLAFGLARIANRARRQ